MADYTQIANGYTFADMSVYTSAVVSAGYAVKLDTNQVPSTTQGPGVLVTTTDAKPLGIMVDTTAASGYGRCRVYGIAVAIAGSGAAAASVTYGDWLCTDSNGFVVTSACGDTKQVIGMALKTAASGENVDILLTHSRNS